MSIVASTKSLTETSLFKNFIIGVIALAGILVGVETYPSIAERYAGILHFLDQTILWIFVAEVVLKLIAEGTKPQNYFKDPWNIFDFTIVAVCFLPIDASFVAVLRLARILRVLRIVTALPELQILVGALLRSIPSMGYVGLLLSLLFYIYACVAVTIFGPNDPHHFGDLQIAMLSLFRVVTLEDWTDIMYIAMYGCANYGYDGMQELCTNSTARPLAGALFYSSFVLLGTMIVLNLFIGVIMNGMDETQKEHELQKIIENGEDNIETQAIQLTQKLDEVTHQLEVIRKMAADMNSQDKNKAA